MNTVYSRLSAMLTYGMRIHDSRRAILHFGVALDDSIIGIYMVACTWRGVSN